MEHEGPLLNRQSLESMELNTKKFNEEQKNAVNRVVGEIIQGIRTQNLHAPVKHPFNHQSARAYFLDAPGNWKNVCHSCNPINFEDTQA